MRGGQFPLSKFGGPFGPKGGRGPLKGMLFIELGGMGPFGPIIGLWKDGPKNGGIGPFGPGPGPIFGPHILGGIGPQ